MSIDLNTSEQNVIAGSVLTPGLVDLQKFMFSDRYHLTASALARVCPSFCLMLWITTFNRCTMSHLLLLLNVFLKVRSMYFKADSSILGDFQCSACSAGAPPPPSPPHLHLLHYQFLRCWGNILGWSRSIQGCLTELSFSRVCRSLLKTF